MHPDEEGMEEFSYKVYDKAKLKQYALSLNLAARTTLLVSHYLSIPLPFKIQFDRNGVAGLSRYDDELEGGEGGLLLLSFFFFFFLLPRRIVVTLTLRMC